MKHLLSFLHPHAREDLATVLPKGAMPVWPWYTNVSRINYKPDAFNCVVGGEHIDYLTSLPYHQLSFSDLMDKRALEILKKDGPIFVMWSGGLDSTGVVSAILKTWPKEELKRVTILCSSMSIKENRKFFPHIVKNFKIAQVTHKLESYAKLGHVVTGELADQIYGADTMYVAINVFGESSITEDWRKIAPGTFQSIDPVYGLDTFNNYANIVSESPVEIKTAFDFFWWINFTQKWQHVKYRALMSTSWTDPKKYFSKVIHFYEPVDFQLWSIHKPEARIPTTWNEYKSPTKEYIADYTKDDSSFNLLKIASGPNLYVGIDYHWAIDEDWNYVSKDEAFKRIRTIGE
jgi:hypothetical protein